MNTALDDLPPWCYTFILTSIRQQSFTEANSHLLHTRSVSLGILCYLYADPSDYKNVGRVAFISPTHHGIQDARSFVVDSL